MPSDSKRPRSAEPLERREQNMLFSEKSKDNEGVFTSHNSVEDFLSDNLDEFESINRSPRDLTLQSLSDEPDSEVENYVRVLFPRPAMTRERAANMLGNYKAFTGTNVTNNIIKRAPGDDTDSSGTVL